MNKVIKYIDKKKNKDRDRNTKWEKDIENRSIERINFKELILPINFRKHGAKFYELIIPD